ncbi:hypothetical protein [Herpetosiphon gulosus]|uniref:Metallo-beta-lactamase domain-containing protein n=1 Tax=Herpetosiphon gulosus TaxID=1973496 RepID=A0ABP9X693_9CHLR
MQQFWRRWQQLSNWQRWLGRIIMVSCVVIGWQAWQHRPDGNIHLFVPAIAGNSVLVQTPNAKQIIIDASTDPVTIMAIMGQRLPFWQRQIDLLVLTSNEPQQLSGALALARSYQINLVLTPAFESNPVAAELAQALTQQRSRVVLIESGQKMTVDQVQLTILAAPQAQSQAIIQLQFGAWHSLIGLNPSDQVAKQLTVAANQCHVLIWPWSRGDDRLLANRCGAQALIYSQGPPEQQDPRSYFARGSQERRLLHEKLDGSVHIHSDGQQMWLQTHAQP